jgi:hypothetical protein
MHIQLTGDRDELDIFMRDFRSAFHGRYAIGHYTSTAEAAGRYANNDHVRIGFLLAGPLPREIDPHERLDTPPAACQERVWLDGMGPTTCGRKLVDGVCGRHGRVVGGTVAEIAQRLADSGAVVTVMAPDGRTYRPADVTLVGPANGPQRPSEGPADVASPFVSPAEQPAPYVVPCDEGAPS